MATKSFIPLHEFTVALQREVDETVTRVENGVTITETKKVNKTVNIPFAFKVPSRLENEEADIVQASWWSKFIERGVMAEAMLIKLYTNQGGTMPEHYRGLLDGLQVEFYETEKALIEAEVLDKDNLEKLRPLRLRFFDLREQITAIHRSQAPYFENTAEAKSREKHIEWLVLHMSFYRPVAADESLGEWTPLLPGKTVEDKLTVYDDMMTREDELLMKSKDMLQLVATFFSSSKGRVTGDQISTFLETDEEWVAKSTT